ncbi:hypothetical protein JCM19992_10530 [Thermostilla marina]
MHRKNYRNWMLILVATGVVMWGSRFATAAGFPFFDANILPASFEAPPDPAANDVPDQWVEGEWDQIEKGAEPVREPVSPFCEICGDSLQSPPLWTWYNGSRIWSHSRPRRATLSFDYNNDDVLTTKMFNLDVAAGYETRVRRYLGTDIGNHNQYVEFVYWGLNEWSAMETAQGTTVSYDLNGNTFTGGSLFTEYRTDFDYATWQQMRYRSNIHNFELNLVIEPRGGKDRMAMLPNGRWQRRCREGAYLTWLFGFRGMSLDEGYIFTSSGFLTDVNGTTPLWGQAAIRTHNDMFGLQAGAILTVRKHRLRWGASVKAAPMINWSDQFTDIYELNNTGYQGYASNDGAAFMGEVGIFADYRLTDFITVHAGFDMGWLVGMALAPEQVDYRLPDTPTVNDNGYVFFQGLTLGFDTRW